MSVFNKNPLLLDYMSIQNNYISDNRGKIDSIVEKFQNLVLCKDHYCYIYFGPIPDEIDLSIEDVLSCAIYVGEGRKNRIFEQLNRARDRLIKEDIDDHTQKICSIWNADQRVTILKIKSKLTKQEGECYEAVLMKALGTERDGKTGPLLNGKDGNWKTLAETNKSLKKLSPVQIKLYGIHILHNNIHKALRYRMEFARPGSGDNTITRPHALTLEEAVDDYLETLETNRTATVFFGNSKTIDAFNEAAFKKKKREIIDAKRELQGQLNLKVGTRVRLTHTSTVGGREIPVGSLGTLKEIIGKTDKNNNESTITRLEIEFDHLKSRIEIERIAFFDENKEAEMQFPVAVAFAVNFYDMFPSKKDVPSKLYQDCFAGQGFIDVDWMTNFKLPTNNLLTITKAAKLHNRTPISIYCGDNYGVKYKKNRKKEVRAAVMMETPWQDNRLWLSGGSDSGFCNAFIQLMRASTYMRYNPYIDEDNAVAMELKKLLNSSGGVKSCKKLLRLLAEGKEGDQLFNDATKFAGHFLSSLPKDIAEGFAVQLQSSYNCTCEWERVYDKQLYQIQAKLKGVKPKFEDLTHISECARLKTERICPNCGSKEIHITRTVRVYEHTKTLLIALPIFANVRRVTLEVSSPPPSIRMFDATWKLNGVIQHDENDACYTTWVKRSNGGYDLYNNEKHTFNHDSPKMLRDMYLFSLERVR